ncbi:MAG TPA: molybdopterin converting factor subunit 1 [Burkholderiaceae bacterium]
MQIALKFFASVREALGSTGESLAVPAGVATLGQLRAHLAARGGVWEQTLGPQRTLRMAYQHVMSGPETALTDGCEVAFFPPMTGG